MFDKPNQLVFNINGLIVVYGIFIILFSDYFFTGLLFIISALLLILVLYQQKKGTYTISHLEKTLTINNASGSRATLTCEQLTTANHVSNSEYWFNNIYPSGSISNIRINGNPPSEQKKEDRNIHVCMKFSPELKATEEFSINLSYDYRDVFTNSENKISHIVDDDTKLLRLVVELPTGRSVASAKVFCKNNDVSKPLLPPIISGQTKIEAEINNPIFGAEYSLQWDWPRDGLSEKIYRFFSMRN